MEYIARKIKVAEMLYELNLDRKKELLPSLLIKVWLKHFYDIKNILPLSGKSFIDGIDFMLIDKTFIAMLYYDKQILVNNTITHTSLAVKEGL